MLQKIPQRPPKPRTTLPLQGTVEETRAGLDVRSALALQWAQAWCHRPTGLKHLPAAVVRRALQHYCGYLAALAQAQPGEIERELRHVRDASNPLPTDPEALEAALARLSAIPAGEPLPYLHRVLNPDAEAFVASVEARTEALLPRRYRTTTNPGQETP